MRSQARSGKAGRRSADYLGVCTAVRMPAEYRMEARDADAFDFACNAVNCGQHVFLNRASAALIHELQSRGFAVRQTPLTEFMKAGGSAKCLTLKLTEARLAVGQVAA